MQNQNVWRQSTLSKWDSNSKWVSYCTKAYADSNLNGSDNTDTSKRIRSAIDRGYFPGLVILRLSSSDSFVYLGRVEDRHCGSGNPLQRGSRSSPSTSSSSSFLCSVVASLSHLFSNRLQPSITFST